MASGLLQLRGVANLEGWKWWFLVDGTITVLTVGAVIITNCHVTPCGCVLIPGLSRSRLAHFRATITFFSGLSSPAGANIPYIAIIVISPTRLLRSRCHSGCYNYRAYSISTWYSFFLCASVDYSTYNWTFVSYAKFVANALTARRYIFFNALRHLP
jgi:hypothetical protein